MPSFDFSNQIFGNFKVLTSYNNIVLSWSKNIQLAWVGPRIQSLRKTPIMEGKVY